MKTHFNLKFIVILLFTILLFSCKNNISGRVGSDGKSLDSTRTSTDTANVRTDTLKKSKQ